MTTLSTNPSTAPRRPSRPAGKLPVATIDPFRVLRRYWMLIVFMGLLGIAGGIGAWLGLARFFPLYRGTLYLEVRGGLARSTDVGSNDLTQDQLVFRIANTETMLLQSRQVLREALQSPEVQATSWYRNNYVDATGLEDALDDLVDDVGTSVVRGSNLFTVSWACESTGDVPVVLNKIADAYMNMRRKLDDAIYIDNKNAFQRQLTNTSSELEDLSAEMEAYIRANDLGTLDGARYSQTALAIQELTKQIATIGSALTMSEVAYKQTAEKQIGLLDPSADDILTAQRESQVQLLDQSISRVRTSLRQLREKYNQPDHTSILEEERYQRAIEAEREELMDEIIKRNLAAQQKSLDSEIQRYTDLMESLTTEQDAKQAEMRELSAKESTYNAMEMRRNHLEKARDNDLTLIKEVELMRLRTESRRVRIAQRPSTPRELYFPKPEVIIPLGGLSLTGLTVGLIFLRELTDRRVRTASDLAVIPHGRVLGVIPEVTEDPTKTKRAELVVRKHPHSVLAESYRQVWTPIAREMDRAGHQSLLVTSCLPGAGSTTAITNVAASAAASGKQVLIVDANFRRPRMPQALEIEANGPGLGDLLDDAVTVDETIVDIGSGMYFMPAGTEAQRVTERLNNGQLDTIIAQLRSRYDLILFDAPPAVVAGDAVVLANKVDASVLIVRANREQRGLVSRVMNQLSDAQCDFIGLVLNRPRGTAGGYFKKNFAEMASYASH